GPRTGRGHLARGVRRPALDVHGRPRHHRRGPADRRDGAPGRAPLPASDRRAGRRAATRMPSAAPRRARLHGAGPLAVVPGAEALLWGATVAPDVRVFGDAEELGTALASEVVELVAGVESDRFLLGCPGGRSLRSTYRALAAHREELRKVTVVMMDEYV